MSVSGDSFSDTASRSEPASRISADSLNRDGGSAQDLLEQEQSFKSTVFGVAYVVSAVKLDKTITFGLLRLAIDYLQLFILMFDPEVGWHFNENMWVYKWLQYVVFVKPIETKGYNFYLAMFYLGVALFVTVVLLSIWIAWCFQQDMKQNSWAVKPVRLLVTVFSGYFFSSSLALFMMSFECQPFNPDQESRFTLHKFGTKCLVLPHLAHASVSLVIALLFLAVSTLMTIGDVETNPSTARLYGSTDAFAEMATYVTKAIIIFLVFIVDEAPKWRALGFLACTLFLTRLFLIKAPHFNQWVNHIRVAQYASLLWMSILQTVFAFHKGSHTQHMCSKIFLAGLGPVLVAGFAVSHWYYTSRMNRVVAAFRATIAGDTKLSNIYNFHDPVEVELGHRCCLNSYNRKVDTWNEEYVKLAENIIKAGLAQYPKDPRIYVLNSNFLIDVKGNYQSGHSQLQVAKRLKPDVWLQYIIFMREQEHRRLARSHDHGKESTTDLASYVEFQKNYRLLMRRHKAALSDVKDFWRQLLFSDIKFTTLVKAFSNIEKSQRLANKTYQMVLDRYPYSVKLVRSYALFMEEVMNDPWLATKYYSEADKLEEAENEDEQEPVYEEGEDADSSMLAHVNEKTNAVFVANSAGTIQIANKVALQMFGYKKGELDGKNLSILMPPPFSQRHASYMRNCITQGKEKSAVLGQIRSMVALHKDRFVFPIKLGVSKVSGTGSDTIFMGVIMREEQEQGTVRAWVLPNGSIVCVDQQFYDWFGFAPTEVVGRPFVNMVHVENQNEAASFIKTATNEGGEAATVELEILHKYMECVKVRIESSIGGSDSQPIYILTFRRAADTQENIMVLDHRARFMFATNQAASIFGYTPQQLMTMEATQLIPAPFNNLHNLWLKDMTGRAPPASCRSGLVTMAQNSSNIMVPIKMQFSTQEVNEALTFIINVEKATVQEGIDQRCLVLQVDASGKVLGVGKSPVSTFGFPPAALEGRPIWSFVNIFEELFADGGEEAVENMLQSLALKSAEARSVSWRVGVHMPAQTEAGSEAQMLKMRASKAPTKAAVIQVELMPAETEELNVQYEVKLFRADLLTGTLEVDHNGLIVKSGTSDLYKPGIMFGVASSSLTRQPLESILNLGRLGIDALVEDQQRRGNLKTSMQGIRNIPPKKFPGLHMDGQPLEVLLESSYKDSSMRRVCMKLTVVKPSSGSLQAVRRSLAKPGATSLLLEEDDPPRIPPAMTSPNGNVYRTSSYLEVPAALAAARSSGGGCRRSSISGLRTLQKPSVTFATPGDGSAPALPVEQVAAADLPSDSLISVIKDDMAPSQTMGFHEIHPNKAAVLGNQLYEDTDMLDESSEQQQHRTSVSRVSDWYQRLSSPDQVPYDPPGSDDEAVEPTRSDPRTFQLFQADDSSVSENEDPVGPEGEDVSTWQSDYKRGKRAKKLVKMLSNKQAQEPMNLCVARLKLTMVVLMMTQVTSFAIFHTLFNDLYSYVNDVSMATKVIDYHTIASWGSQVLREVHNNRSVPGLYTAADVPYWVNLMHNSIDTAQHFHYSIYLGTKKLRRLKNNANVKLQTIFENATLPAIYLSDAKPAALEKLNVSLWDMFNDWSAAAREVTSNHDLMAAQGDLKFNRFWQMVKQNVPWNIFTPYLSVMDGLVYRSMLKIFHTNGVVKSLLIVEGVVVVAIAIVYISSLLSKVASHRYNLHSVFLMIPSGYLRALATKQIHVDAEDDDDDDRDVLLLPPAGGTTTRRAPEDAVTTNGKTKIADMSIARTSTIVPLAKGAALWQQVCGYLVQARVAILGNNGPIQINKKTLVKDGKDTLVLLVPFICWAIAVLVIYFHSYVELKNMGQPMLNVLLSGHVRYRVVRTAYFAHEVTIGETLAERASSKASMMKVAGRLESAYRALLYGSGPTRDTLWGSKGALFDSKTNAKKFFELQGHCLRADKENCRKPGDALYEVTHNGVDVMIRRFLNEITLLNKDNSTEITTDSSRLSVIWYLGRYDLFHGCKEVAALFVNQALSNITTLLSYHVILFSMAWVAALCYFTLALKPFLRNNLREIKFISELLSHLPPDMDVEGLVEQALAIKPAPGKTGKREGDEASNKMASSKSKLLELGKTGSQVAALRAGSVMIGTTVTQNPLGRSTAADSDAGSDNSY